MRTTAAYKTQQNKTKNKSPGDRPSSRQAHIASAGSPRAKSERSHDHQICWAERREARCWANDAGQCHGRRHAALPLGRGRLSRRPCGSSDLRSRWLLPCWPAGHAQLCRRGRTAPPSQPALLRHLQQLPGVLAVVLTRPLRVISVQLHHPLVDVLAAHGVQGFVVSRWLAPQFPSVLGCRLLGDDPRRGRHGDRSNAGGWSAVCLEPTAETRSSSVSVLFAADLNTSVRRDRLARKASVEIRMHASTGQHYTQARILASIIGPTPRSHSSSCSETLLLLKEERSSPG